MTQEEPKTMTAREAWMAMVDGGFVETRGACHAIKGNSLCYWDGWKWKPTTWLLDGPYSIVPDPSQPVDEYEKDRKRFVDDPKRHSIDFEREAIIEFIEKHYVRKEMK